MDATADFKAVPCGHLICSSCWEQILTRSAHHECPYCRQAVHKVIAKGIELDSRGKFSLEKAYSCVHTNDFEYALNKYVHAEGFDCNLSKVCAPGIHFHDKKSDVFKWFEYLDIPDVLMQNKVPLD